MNVVRQRGMNALWIREWSRLRRERQGSSSVACEVRSGTFRTKTRHPYAYLNRVCRLDRTNAQSTRTGVQTVFTTCRWVTPGVHRHSRPLAIGVLQLWNVFFYRRRGANRQVSRFARMIVNGREPLSCQHKYGADARASQFLLPPTQHHACILSTGLFAPDSPCGRPCYQS